MADARDASQDPPRRKPTPPSQAPGESGDQESRREAEEALAGERDGEAADAPGLGTEAQKDAPGAGSRNNRPTGRDAGQPR
ncbi:hypothetical protein [Streptomyces bauhiniae]|uniref:hypothetical protein n=1 Tax=Streptomyces bauhiniae TaxID=2340725 RepID=UPI0035DD6E4A